MQPVLPREPIDLFAPILPTTPMRIGVFDSGVGGLSVLRSLRSLMPAAELIYVADSGHAPYGERDDDFVAERSERIAAYLFEKASVQLLVVACNTATAAAVHRVRALWPQTPIVGVEPGVKPAVAASVRQSIGVLATPSTLRSGKFQRLLEQYSGHTRVHLQPCPGLAGMIESGHLDASPLLSMIEDFCAPLRRAQVDVVVLGCTHYAFVRQHIARSLGHGVQIIDTADAVARQAAHLATPIDATIIEPDAERRYSQGTRVTDVTQAGNVDPKPGEVCLLTTGDVERLGRIAKSWLSFDFSVEACDI